MSIHEEIQASIPEFSLGALEEAVAAQIEEHLAICRVCTQVLREFHSVVDALALAAPLAEPSPGLKERIVRRALGFPAGNQL